MMSFLLVLLSLFFGMSGSVIDTGPEYPAGTDVQVPVGSEVFVVLGTGNDSIGHNYYVVEGEQNPYARVADADTDTKPGCQPGGCSYTHRLSLKGMKPGTFKIVTQYCFRTDLNSCDKHGEESVTTSVTVTA